MNKSKNIALILGVLIMSLGIVYLVTAWTEPGAAPPGGAVPPPLHEGIAIQTKQGGLNIMGNVGIGTTAPTGKLHVIGGTAAADTTGAPITIQGQAGGADGADADTLGGVGGDIILLPGASGAGQPAGNVGIGTTAPTGRLHVLQTGTADAFRVDDVVGDTSPFMIDQHGNVGIGTITPVEMLHVVGNILGTGNLNVDIDTLFVDATINRVGIGTTAPAGRLHITSDVAVTGETGIIIDIPGIGTRRILVGPLDSGGVGFRSLKIAN